MKKRAVIFGTGSFAEVADFYLRQDSDYEVVAFTATGEADDREGFLGRPFVPFETVDKQYSPSDHVLFVAVGYRRMNQLRQRFCTEARKKGYSLLSYVCSRLTHWGDARIGDNVFLFEDNTIQPFVTIGDGTVLWSGNHVGHHSTIGSYCFITSHVIISGGCAVGDRCFMGVNATIADHVKLGNDNLIGPGALVQKDTADGEVYLSEPTAKFPKGSSRFFR